MQQATSDRAFSRSSQRVSSREQPLAVMEADDDLRSVDTFPSSSSSSFSSHDIVDFYLAWHAGGSKRKRANSRKGRPGDPFFLTLDAECVRCNGDITFQVLTEILKTMWEGATEPREKAQFVQSLNALAPVLAVVPM